MERRQIKIALAGNANVGKSAIFNQLTGLNQIIGNWPGKTVERAEGTLHFKGYTINVIDLPGIYSLSTFSIEEIIARDYIAIERPDAAINVIDASALERNLYFTIQLIELEAPIVIALNQVDFAAKKGIRIDHKKLSEILGIPIVPTVAVRGIGIKELISKAIDLIEGKIGLKPIKIKYGKEIEDCIEEIESLLKQKLPEFCLKYSARWISIKLIERDEDIRKKILDYEQGKEVLSKVENFIKDIEKLHGEQSSVIMACERYSLANRIAKNVTDIIVPPKITLEEKLDSVLANRFLGYPILASVFASIFIAIFFVGNVLVEFLEGLFNGVLTPLIIESLATFLPEAMLKIVSEGLISGIVAGITIALPYILPFYLLLSILEDSGYLPRAAFLMDNPMHKIGLHGKASICFLLGYGCSVPACMGCRIMETERERFLAGFLTILVPCAARTVVILGLVARYIGSLVALALYFFNMVLIFVLGRIGYRTLPGEPVGLIMEMPHYRVPSIKDTLSKTWVRTKDFIYVAFPIIIGGSFVLEAFVITGLANEFLNLISPLITLWLGLPKITGIPLIFGILRKELTLILLAQLSGTINFNEVLSPVQMVVFSLVTMIYVPCVATIAALIKEFGIKKAVLTSIIDVLLALLLGGILFRVLQFLF
ncbi:MAG: ferrous iron transport protein B [Candidatus Bathyarchaeia archaeon]